jgi:hypothetical protein
LPATTTASSRTSSWPDWLALVLLAACAPAAVPGSPGQAPALVRVPVERASAPSWLAPAEPTIIHFARARAIGRHRAVLALDGGGLVVVHDRDGVTQVVPGTPAWVGVDARDHVLVAQFDGQLGRLEPDGSMTRLAHLHGAPTALDASTLVAAITGDQQVHVSSDGGATFRSTSIPGVDGIEEGLADVQTRLDGAIVVRSDGGQLWLSTDGGRTFTRTLGQAFRLGRAGQRIQAQLEDDRVVTLRADAASWVQAAPFDRRLWAFAIDGEPHGERRPRVTVDWPSAPTGPAAAPELELVDVEEDIDSLRIPLRRRFLERAPSATDAGSRRWFLSAQHRKILIVDRVRPHEAVVTLAAWPAVCATELQVAGAGGLGVFTCQDDAGQAQAGSITPDGRASVELSTTGRLPEDWRAHVSRDGTIVLEDARGQHALVRRPFEVGEVGAWGEPTLPGLAVTRPLLGGCALLVLASEDDRRISLATLEADARVLYLIADVPLPDELRAVEVAADGLVRLQLEGGRWFAVARDGRLVATAAR